MVVLVLPGSVTGPPPNARVLCRRDFLATPSVAPISTWTPAVEVTPPRSGGRSEFAQQGHPNFTHISGEETGIQRKQMIRKNPV